PGAGTSASVPSHPSATARRRATASPIRSGRPCVTTAARRTLPLATLADCVCDLCTDIDRSLLMHRMAGRGEVHEVLAVARRPRMRRIAHAEDGGALAGHEIGKVVQHLCTDCWIAHHAAANLGASGLELGLHEH